MSVAPVSGSGGSEMRMSSEGSEVTQEDRDLFLLSLVSGLIFETAGKSQIEYSKVSEKIAEASEDIDSDSV